MKNLTRAFIHIKGALEDRATAFAYKYRKVYLWLFIPSVIVSMALISVAPNIRLNAQTSPNTDIVTDLGFPDANITDSDYTIRFINAMTVEMTFVGKPDKKIIWTATAEERLNNENDTYKYTPTNRTCGEALIYNRKSQTMEVDLDVRLSASSTSANNNCVSTTKNKYDGVGVQSPDLFDAYFEVVSMNEIRRADGDGDWLFTANDPAHPEIYTRNSETTGCVDMLIRTGNDVTLYELNDDESTDKGTYTGNPPFDAPGCKYRTGGPAPIRNVKNFIPNDVALPLSPDSIAANSDKPAGSGSTSGIGGVGGEENPTCETLSSNPMSWFICPIFNGIVDSIAAIFSNFIEPFLFYNPISTTPSAENGPYNVWLNFRFIGNIILVGALIVAIFGQSIGGGLIDAYTAKKMLPRILIAGILVNISIYIVAFASDIANAAGKSLGALMTTPFDDAGAFDFTASGADFSAGLVTALAAIIIAMYKVRNSPGGGTLGNYMLTLLVSVFLPLFLVTLAIFATLIIRRGLILFLAIVSPVAFALYAIPTTEKYFKKWWSLYTTTLMTYPIIVVMFALSNIMFATVRTSGVGGIADVLASLAGFVILFIPLVLIPFAFKLAGSVLGGIYGAVSSNATKANQFAQGDPRDPNSFAARWARKRRDKATEYRGRAVAANRFDDVSAMNEIKELDKKRSAGGLTPEESNRYNDLQAQVSRHRSARGRYLRLNGRFIDRTAGEAVDAETSRLNKEKAEIRDNMISTGDDSLVYAGAGYEEMVDVLDSDENVVRDADGNAVQRLAYKNSKGKEISKETYRAGKRFFGQSKEQIAQNLEYTLRKAQSDKDVAEFRKAFTNNAMAEGWTGDEVMGAWATATYPHKGAHPSEWYSKPSVITGTDGRRSLQYDDISTSDSALDSWLGDKSRTAEGFRLSSLRDQEWNMLDTRRQELETKAIAGTATKQDLTRMAQIHAMFDAAANRVGYNPEGGTLDADKVVSSGASAVAQKVIQNAMGNSRVGPNGEIRYTPAYKPGEVAMDSTRVAGRVADIDLRNPVTNEVIVPANKVISEIDQQSLAQAQQQAQAAGKQFKGWNLRGGVDASSQFVNIMVETKKTVPVIDRKTGQQRRDPNTNQPLFQEVSEWNIGREYTEPINYAGNSDSIRSAIVNVGRDRSGQTPIQASVPIRPGDTTQAPFSPYTPPKPGPTPQSPPIPQPQPQAPFGTRPNQPNLNQINNNLQNFGTGGTPPQTPPPPPTPPNPNPPTPPPGPNPGP